MNFNSQIHHIFILIWYLIACSTYYLKIIKRSKGLKGKKERHIQKQIWNHHLHSGLPNIKGNVLLHANLRLKVTPKNMLDDGCLLRGRWDSFFTPKFIEADWLHCIDGKPTGKEWCLTNLTQTYHRNIIKKIKSHYDKHRQTESSRNNRNLMNSWASSCLP